MCDQPIVFKASGTLCCSTCNSELVCPCDAGQHDTNQNSTTPGRFTSARNKTRKSYLNLVIYSVVQAALAVASQPYKAPYPSQDMTAIPNTTPGHEGPTIPIPTIKSRLRPCHAMPCHSSPSSPGHLCIPKERKPKVHTHTGEDLPRGPNQSEMPYPALPRATVIKQSQMGFAGEAPRS
jgi:hypothetical protein